MKTKTIILAVAAFCCLAVPGAAESAALAGASVRFTCKNGKSETRHVPLVCQSDGAWRFELRTIDIPSTQVETYHPTDQMAFRWLEMYRSSLLRKQMESLKGMGFSVEDYLGEGGTVATLEEDSSSQDVKSLPDLLEAIRARGRKGMSIYRFKGLGEMDTDELYETTMDPAKRHMLRVKLSDAVKADQMFSLLMGDEVEPRRKFIEDNALNVRNLDF